MLHIRFLDRPLGLPILVIYLAAFPACWLLSRYFRSSKNAAKHAKISLLCASFLLYQTWFLCCPTNAELELLPHVRLDQRNAARALDSIVAFCVFSLAIPIGVWLFRRRATYDESEVERDFAGVDVQWHRRKEYIDDFSQHAVTTAWLTLLLCYLLTLSSGLTALGMSGVLDNHPHVTVAWWQFPMYNIASHIALFHIVLGMMEAILYSEQIRAVRSTVEFEDPNQKLSFWDRFLDDRVPYRPLAGCVPSVGTKDRDDCEIGCVAKAGAGEGTGSASYRTLIGPAPIPRAEQPKQKEIYQGCPSPYSVEPRQLESGALDQTLDAPQRQPSRALAKRDLRRFVLQSLAFERSGSETDRQILQDL